MEIQFPHKIIYTNQGKIPVREIANSLLAQATLIEHLKPIMEGCIDGVSIEKIELIFKEAKHNSPLEEAFFVSVLLAYQKNLEEEVPEIIKNMGIDLPEKFHSIVTVLSFILIYYGIKFACNKFSSRKKPEIRVRTH